MSWKISSDRPAYLQLIEVIEQRIVSGIYKPGDKLKSVRDLAVEAQVNPNTMQKALSELEENGLIYSQKTTGKYVTENQELIESTRELFAEHALDLYFEKMSKLGYSKEEAKTKIEKR